MSSTASPTIVIDLPHTSAWDRSIAQGIIAFGRERSWNLILASPTVPLADHITTWNPDALIGCFDSRPALPPGHEDQLLISIGRDASAHGIPSVCPNETLIGELAAQHLLATGLRQVAVFAYDDSPFARERATAFSTAIEAAGGVCLRTGEFSNRPGAANFCSHEAIIHWLKSLPKPVGIFALCDNWAYPVATFCRHLSLRIPDDVALLGVDNDPLICELSSPPLSSVAVPWREMAAVVARIIATHIQPRRPNLPSSRAPCETIDPVDVVARRSTEVLKVDDSLVADAVAFIRANAHQVISVDDILRAVPTYRQRLERQFRAGLGRTVMEEVRRAHIDLAKKLLTTTQLTMPEIAQKSGFSNATLLGINFRKELGITPTEYRRKAAESKPSNPTSHS